jgi:hypothetical protein
MSDTHSYATGTEKLPRSVYFKNNSLFICRGTPSEMVLEMVPREPPPTLQEALGYLVDHIAKTRNITLELPWQAPDEILCRLFIKTLLDLGIVEPTPLS